mgnify:CR=1 FL=1
MPAFEQWLGAAPLIAFHAAFERRRAWGRYQQRTGKPSLVEPVYETVYEEVHVPARYEVREIVKRRHGRRSNTACPSSRCTATSTAPACSISTALTG